MKKTIFKRILCVFFAVFILAALAIPAAAASYEFCYPDFPYNTLGSIYEDSVNNANALGDTNRFFFGKSSDYLSVFNNISGMFNSIFSNNVLTPTFDDRYNFSLNQIELSSYFSDNPGYLYLLVSDNTSGTISSSNLHRIRVPITSSNLNKVRYRIISSADSATPIDSVTSSSLVGIDIRFVFNSPVQVDSTWDSTFDNVTLSDFSVQLFINSSYTFNLPSFVSSSQNSYYVIGCTFATAASFPYQFIYISTCAASSASDLHLYERSGSGSGSGTSDPGDDPDPGETPSTPVTEEEEAVTVLSSLRDFVFSIFMAPSIFLSSILDFTILGINLYTVVKVILTLCLVAFVVALVVKLILHLR